MLRPRYWGVGQRVRTHGIVRGLRYSLGVWFLYPVLNARHKARTAEYEADKGGLNQTCMVVPNSEPRRYGGTVADLMGKDDVSIEDMERFNAWQQRISREGFRRGAMLEALHIVRCDPPEEFHGPYMPVEKKEDGDA
jgi:hypothetical protein